ncbi:MAG: nickel pincer cofactor biosynthesis protein LarC [Gemmatimonadetes bacterium]|nr:nickel pincer cofactor biosynthesis protein LarC [Gemmatimonadota bacterium]NIQ60277.1 nickel pincer cofactor biosynthesis protein LarC [Gemmatimonadota bacterium]NIU73488.1 nickel pincer cofactor biosynthesis protein LarC [Gammaproteobacteria bacterium]NIX43703.1 nickel pincer cofactor biosynthesis protein LarC [Gemmatimonadota bacterium]NIY07896.1 nickel pincer cofactor biosynthesis protein LarC [Gemmatimonadota bacterium]
MRALIIDPFAGISGDMLLGGLVDLGLPGEWLRDFVAATGLPGRVEIERVDRSGIACTRVRLDLPEEPAHRHLPDVLEVIAGSGAEARVRQTAAAVFRRLAEAEAAVHGVAVEEVHFHEVGALDSILDVLCGTAAVYELGLERCYTRPVAVGTGTVAMEHGSYPLPSPATARLLEGMRVRETGYPEECTTPTGAALLAELTNGTPVPAEVIYGRSGFGAGTRDPQGRPNCLRLLECRVTEPGVGVYAVQADIDDLAPEYVAAARDALMDVGALDATLTRIDMKKGRPGVRLEALAEEPTLTAVLDAFFAGTRTIGVRYWRVDRAVLERTENMIEWRGHTIRFKEVRLPDGRVRRKPEYEDVVVAARAEGLAPHELRAELEATRGHETPDR